MTSYTVRYIEVTLYIFPNITCIKIKIVVNNTTCVFDFIYKFYLSNKVENITYDDITQCQLAYIF